MSPSLWRPRQLKHISGLSSQQVIRASDKIDRQTSVWCPMMNVLYLDS